MENPFIEIQRKLRLTNSEFARLLGVSTVTLRTVTRGDTRNPAAMYQALDELGFDAEGVCDQYLEWLERRRQAIIDKVCRR